MQFVKLLKYIVKSYQGKPSFLILMSDGNEYISCGCQFVMNTPENRDKLIEVHQCQRTLNELLSAPDASLDDVTDARHMFEGCKSLTNIELDLPNAIDARYMFYRCTSLTNVELDLPMVDDARMMFAQCESLTSVELNIPNATNVGNTFFGCGVLTSVEMNLPKSTGARCMFLRCYSLAPEIKARYNAI